jgi:hypothetical protein
MQRHYWVVLTAGSTGSALRAYVLFVLPTFTSRQILGAIWLRISATG